MSTYLEDLAAVPTSPTYSSLAAAQASVGDLTLEEYALARVIYSEYASGTPQELCAVGDATINGAKAAHRDLLDHVTAGTNVFGEQGSAGASGRKRPVSTARSPGPRHIRASLALLRGRFWGVVDPPARGISLGARRYFSASGQLSSHRKNPGTHCHPLVILERWTYSYSWGPTRCSLDRSKRGRDQQEWVGPIPGVNAYALMLMRPAGRQQDALYNAAKRVIDTAGADQSGPPLGPAAPLVELLVVVAAAAAAGMLLGGGGTFV